MKIEELFSVALSKPRKYAAVWAIALSVSLAILKITSFSGNVKDIRLSLIESTSWHYKCESGIVTPYSKRANCYGQTLLDRPDREEVCWSAALIHRNSEPLARVYKGSEE